MKHVESANAVLADSVNTFNLQELRNELTPDARCYGYKDIFGSTLSLKHVWSALWVTGTSLNALDNKKILILPAIHGRRQLKANAMQEFNLNFSQCKQKSAH